VTTTSVSDAVVLPQSQGTGLPSESAPMDAALMGVMARFRGDGAYVDTQYASGLAFQNHSASNDTVEIAPGACWVEDGQSSTAGERASGGSPRSARTPPTDDYDIDLPGPTYYLVVFPTAVQISVSDSTLNAVHVDLDVSSNNGVAIEHDGSSTASTGSTSLKIGEANPDDASADTRANDDPELTARSVSTDDINTPQITDADDGTVYDVGDDLAGGGGTDKTTAYFHGGLGQ
jgi:hypothetical protein